MTTKAWVDRKYQHPKGLQRSRDPPAGERLEPRLPALERWPALAVLRQHPRRVVSWERRTG
ncbi:hypothetical protein [Nonomuraea basaltis]|uniref:hypothetical protein n=1 Tax=Nonomuraea basaltis TaxID=2495887 RepID=UPI00110C5BEF|nr:hypothetical protein [Nonomuraea basaltis]TMR96175.1 hypothetical protein EJK15_24945 [Nonomuraea basaltis]